MLEVIFRTRFEFPAQESASCERNGTGARFYSPQYNTPPLQEGSNYSYSVRARWTQDGTPVEQTRTVPFKAGSKVTVDFTSPLP